MTRSYVILFAILHLAITGISQPYLSGETYFGENNYIEYKAGNLPIVISAPHGGALEPEEIPNRDCSGCVYVRDTNTEELIRQMYDAIFEEFGCYSHIIINRLHRRKLDANRAIGEAADGNELGEQAWNDFQNFIELAKDTIEVNFEKGLYLDLHGHGHEIQRLELGYRITKSELQLDDSELNAEIYVNDASVKNLVNDNLNDLELSELLRSAESFGQLYENEDFPAVPSQADPFPMDDESYFSGGYNTERHGSKSGGTVDGIQIECNMDGVRDTHNNREEFAAATAKVLRNYLETHYFGADFLDGNCGLMTSIENEPLIDFPIKVYPNPVGNYFNVELPKTFSNTFSIQIFNELGQNIYQNEFSNQSSILINARPFPKGIYWIKIASKTFTNTYKISK